MRLAISNIAWDVDNDNKVAELLNQFEIDAIDVAPGKYFPDPLSATSEEIERVKNWWADKGVQITGMQGLLFGTVGLNVFGSPSVQDRLIDRLDAICKIGGVLGANRLVFGSPKNRDRTGLDDEQALDVAIEFFRRLGDKAADRGVQVCLEPNPTRYGANFMIDCAETANVVREVNHPAIRMQLDTGAIFINNENIRTVLEECADLIGHVHASEPDLVPLGESGVDHSTYSDAIKRYLPDHIVSVETVATTGESQLGSIKRSLSVVIEHYRTKKSMTA